MEKFSRNLRHALSADAGPPLRALVLVSTGAYCPVHRMHVEVFEGVRSSLEQDKRGTVIAGFMSPSHADYVDSKLRGASIAIEHRVEMCRIATRSSDWVDASAWEGVQRGFVDYPYVTKALRASLRETFQRVRRDVIREVEEKGGPAVQAQVAWLKKSTLSVIYICGADHALKCGLYHEPSPIFYDHVVAIGRSDRETQELRQKRFGLRFSLVQRNLGEMSSTSVRAKMAAGESIDDMVPEGVAEYIAAHHITVSP